MHTLRPNDRRRFTHFPHLGRPPCRSGNSQPAKNTSPPFYVRSAVFLTPSLNPIPTFFLLRRQSPLRRFTHSPPQTTPQKEKRRGISATDTPLSPTPRSLQCSLPHSPRFYTHFTPKSTPFHQQNSPRQNPRFIDAVRHPRRRRFACCRLRSPHSRNFRSHSSRHPLFPVQLPLCFRSRRRHFARHSARLRL